MTFSIAATYNVPARHPFRLIIAKGSVVEFSYAPSPHRAAIVYSFGYPGGVDGAVSDAGGPQLIDDRKESTRCSEGEGSAVITGPNSYGRLGVRYVIHASAGYGTRSLSSTYSSSLECGKGVGLEAIAFCLLSAGRYAGSTTMDDVVKTGLKVIRRYDGYAGLRDVYICAFTNAENEALVRIANQYLLAKSVTALSVKKLFGQKEKRPKEIETVEDSNNNERVRSQAALSEKDAPTNQSKNAAVLGGDGASLKGAFGERSSSELDPPSKRTDPPSKPMGKGKKTLSNLAAYSVPARQPFRLIVARGSVVHFFYKPNPHRAAIVNSLTGRAAARYAANGFAGGVDGAVSDAGGPQLMEDRRRLAAECSEGSAVMTGPNSYGRLRVRYVIHASGAFDDESLSSAYASALECGKNAGLEAIAFSLLSAGKCRGARTVDDVVKIGLVTIGQYEGYAGLKAVYICAYTEAESASLAKHASDRFPKRVVPTFSVWKKFTTPSKKKPKDAVWMEKEEEKHGGDDELLINDGISNTNNEKKGRVPAMHDQSTVQNHYITKGSEDSLELQSSASDLVDSEENSTLAIYNVPTTHPFHIIITRGSVVEFSYPSNPQHSAIVNVTDSECLGGGAVNNAISFAGGRNLLEDRQKLPAKYCASRKKYVRCHPGSAVITGPNSYGSLKVPYVIHCVGARDDEWLSAVYSSCLECGKSANLEAIAFSLISAGSNRGSRSLEEVLKIGLKAIRRFHGYAKLKVVCIFAFTKVEAETLVKVANDELVAPACADSDEYWLENCASALTASKEPITILNAPNQKETEVPRDINPKISLALELKEQIENDEIESTNRGFSENDLTMDSQSLESRSTMDRLSMLDPGSLLARSQEKTEVPGDMMLHSDCLMPLVPSKVGNRAKQDGSCDLQQTSSIGFSNRIFGENDTAVGSADPESRCTMDRLSMLDPSNLLARSQEKTEVPGDMMLHSDCLMPLVPSKEGNRAKQDGSCDLQQTSSTNRIFGENDTAVGSADPESRCTMDRLSMLDPSSLLARIQGKAQVPGDILLRSTYLDNPLVPNKRGSPIEQDGIRGFMQTNSIDFTNRGFGDDDIEMVSQALEKRSIIESIYMNGNRLSMLDKRLTRALAFNHTLKLLWLENNQIYADGAGRLANALMLNETIEHVHLGRNSIRDEGTKRLAEAVQINQTIKTLDLHHNGIGNIGAEQIADAILINHSLQSIDLQRNRIEDIGGRSLTDAVQSNTVITKLDLSHNPIDRTLQQRVNDILIGPRQLSMKKQPYERSSLFFCKLMALEGDDSDVHEKLEVLAMCITDTHMMKFFYTLVSMLRSSGVLTQEAVSYHIQRGLSRTSETCSCSDSISSFKLILEKAEIDNYIQRIDFHRFDNRAEVKRMENAPFIINIIDAVKLNTARIEGLEANLEAIDASLYSIKRGIKRQMKIQATVGFLCAALNAISFGVGGNIVEATIKALDSIIDYSDLAHIQSVAAEWGQGCVEQFETGVQLATDELADELLREAVKKKEALKVISATATMIHAQCLTHPNHATPNRSVNNIMTSSFESFENQQDLGNVMQWLLLYLPQLQKGDAVRYCECLIEDGFDSEDMLGHVREEDLHFMKKAHKLVLMQRIKKTNEMIE